jgi:pimeloyl-ACP methyl ester carboxylesterase
VLGHSHGGVVAIAYAAAYPAHVRKLVVLNSLVRLHAEEMEALMLRRRAEPWYDDARLALDQESAGEYETDDELAAIADRFWPMYFAHFDERARHYLDACVTGERPNRDPLRVFDDGIETWDLRPELGRVQAPALVVTGGEDFICGPTCAEDIASGIAGAREVVLDDCGHFTFVEARERLHEEVARFLA